jgi:Raf kinase inhibitor-like YbhB/YbcL family protein
MRLQIARIAIVVVLATGARGAEEATDVAIAGHVYEPAQLAPDAERLRSRRLPDGFRIAKFAELSNPRMLAVGPDGGVFVSQREPGTLTLLHDGDGDGVAEKQRVVAELPGLHGVVVHGRRLFVATIGEVFSAELGADGAPGALRRIVSDLPDAGQHPNRTLAVGPDARLYISVGSTCNACDESRDESAALLRAGLDGRGRSVFASGLRNTIGFGWHPPSGRLFGMDHGIDWLGNDEQKEELNELVEGGRYGWPYVFADSRLNPQDEVPAKVGLTNADWARQSREPALLYTAHSAPMQMAFYTGAMFPAEYRNDAFVAMRGSWNRKPPSGYEVVRVRFDAKGTPTAIDPFVTGFLVDGGGPGGEDAFFGRPTGVAVAADGALLVADDTGDVVYRVTYGPEVRQADLGARAMLTSRLPEVKRAPESIQVRVDGLAPGAAIPDRHSAYHANQPPLLRWSGVPDGTRSLVVIVEDPDAKSPAPFAHWLVAQIPPGAASLDGAAAAKPAPGAPLLGATHTGKTGWFGPQPPAGDPPHHYHFQVYALDRTLDLPAGFNRQALLDAMLGHVIARGELVGTYQRASPAPVAAGR